MIWSEIEEKKNFAANDNLETWGRRKTEAVPWKLSVHGEKIFIKKLSWIRILSTIKYHMIKDILKLFENLELFSCRYRIIEGKRRWRTIVKKVNTSVFCDRHFFVIATVFLWSVLVCDCHLFCDDHFFCGCHFFCDHPLFFVITLFFCDYHRLWACVTKK